MLKLGMLLKFGSALLALNCFCCVLTAQAQQAQEIVFKKAYLPPNPQEPLEIFNQQLNGKPIAYGQKFVAGENWAKGINFDVRNVSERVITYIGINLLLSVPNKPRGVVTMMEHGQNATWKGRKPTVKMLPGEVVHVAFTDGTYKSFQSMAQHLGAESITEVALEIDRVLFEDDMLWSQGRLHQRGSYNPGAWVQIGEEHPIRPPSAAPITKLPLSGSAIVEVVSQPDAPLLLSLSYVFTTNPVKPQITFRIENLGDKPVRAYAIRRDSVVGQMEDSGLVFGAAWVLDWIMQKGQWYGGIYVFEGINEPPNHIALSLDFVEFEDGTTWGADTFRSAEHLAARRAAAKLERARLLQTLTAGGVTALIQALQPPATGAAAEPLPEPAKSQRYGIQTLRSHLLGVYKHEGAAALIEELKNPPAHVLK